jgi:hypothetical protein
MDTQRSAAVRVGDAEVGVNVDINLQQVEEDSRAHNGANNTEMDDYARRVMQERREQRKKATVKGYRKGLACWAAFCERRHFTDKDLVHEKKILLFLKEEVLTMRVRKKAARGTATGRRAGNGSSVTFLPPSTTPEAPEMLPLTPETIEAGYVSPLVDLWTEQSSLGSNPYPHPRGALLRGQMKSLKQDKVKQAREGFADRAVGKLNDGYTAAEYGRLCSLMFDQKEKVGIWLRTRLDIQLLHAGVLRSESNRSAEFADISMYQLGGEEGQGSWTPCMILTITDGKTIEAGKADYTGILRHKDPILCPLASLALYLLWRFDIDHEPIPDFRHRSTWYRTRLIPGMQEETNSLSYETQALWVRHAFAMANIHSSKVTHTMRGAAARMADSQGVPEDQLRRAGHWERGSSMLTAYLSGLPREFMRVIAGFPGVLGHYHLRRAGVKPPKALKDQIWPWVDSWLERYKACIVSGCSFADGGLDSCDLAGKAFLELLDWLRDILLQDAAVLQHRFPLFPLWRHPVFSHPAWRSFADDVLVAHNTAEEPINMRIRSVLPDLEETVRSTREAVLSRVDLQSTQVNRTLEEGFARVNDGLNALRMSIPEQLFAVPRSVINQDALASYLARQTAAPSQTQLPATPVTGVVSTAAAVPSSASSASASSAAAASASPAAAASASSAAASASSAAAASGSSLVPLTAGGWPVQPYDPSVTTVEDAWREWHVGLGAGAAKRDSILTLEEKFGCLWRYEQRIRQCHSRRKKIIRMIEQRVGQGHALQDVFADLNATGKSLDRMRKDLEKGVNLFSNVY